MAVHGGAVPAGLGSPCPCLPHSCSHGAELALALLAGCPALCPAPCPAPALRQWPAQGTVSIRQKRLPALGCRSGFVVIERLFSGRRRVFFFSFFFFPLSPLVTSAQMRHCCKQGKGKQSPLRLSSPESLSASCALWLWAARRLRSVTALCGRGAKATGAFCALYFTLDRSVDIPCTGSEQRCLLWVARWEGNVKVRDTAVDGPQSWCGSTLLVLWEDSVALEAVLVAAAKKEIVPKNTSLDSSC